jgi:hypothetical protein
MLIASAAVPFDSPAMYAPLGVTSPTGPMTVLEAGMGDGSFDDSMSLHHPAVAALFLKGFASFP